MASLRGGAFGCRISASCEEWGLRNFANYFQLKVDLSGNGARRHSNLVNFRSNSCLPSVAAAAISNGWPANFEICRVGFVNFGVRCWESALRQAKTTGAPTSSRKALERRGGLAEDELVDYSKFLFENEPPCSDLDSRRKEVDVGADQAAPRCCAVPATCSCRSAWQSRPN